MKLLTVTFALLLLAGCTHTPVPVAHSYPESKQKRVQSAHHWNLHAADLAQRISARLEADGVINNSYFIYIDPPPVATEETNFANTFFNLIESQLVQHNVRVSTNKEHVATHCVMVNSCKPLQMSYEVNVLHYDNRDNTLPWPEKWGVGIALAGIVYAAAESSQPWIAAIPIAMAFGMRDASVMEFPGETATEAVISVNVKDGDHVIFSDSQVYYINTIDDEHYRNEEPVNHKYKVTDK
ncbi:MAG: hypothetical protein HQL49_10920 [Gammaproteobacteria bacterium]|nr:hypothetical protein [Gammaproteobacteria bacterium]